MSGAAHSSAVRTLVAAAQVGGGSGDDDDDSIKERYRDVHGAPSRGRNPLITRGSLSWSHKLYCEKTCLNLSLHVVAWAFARAAAASTSRRASMRACRLLFDDKEGAKAAEQLCRGNLCVASKSANHY